MTNNDQLHQEFLNDFTELLRKYKAQFDMYEGSPSVFFDNIFDADHNLMRSWSELTLPNYINPN